MEGADLLYFKMPKIHFFKEGKGATQLYKTLMCLIIIATLFGKVKKNGEKED